MKATGNVRRIDDTGDIIIPVEVRREYKIKEGDFVEIYVEDDNTIVFQKYSHLEKEKVFLSQCIASANKSAQVKLLVVDKDKMIGIRGLPKNLISIVLKERKEERYVSVI